MDNLQQLIDSKSNLVDFFYNDNVSQIHKQINKLLSKFNSPEYTNWREEQRAWRESAVLFDQSYHMPVLYVRGKDAHRMLTFPRILLKICPPTRASSISAATRGESISAIVSCITMEKKRDSSLSAACIC